MGGCYWPTRKFYLVTLCISSGVMYSWWLTSFKEPKLSRRCGIANSMDQRDLKTPITDFDDKSRTYQYENLTAYVQDLRKGILSHQALNPYFIPRENKVNPYNYTYLIDGREICQGEAPFLVIIVPSVYTNHKARQMIRATWGNVTKTKVWADGTPLPTIKLVFLFGIRKDGNVFGILKNESLEHGDIVLADFIDSYRNLTIKTMSALNWITLHCRETKYFLKNDEDTVVFLPRLFNILRQGYTDSLIGCQGRQLNVVRNGSFPKWVISKEEYPPDLYPSYIFGSFYIIPNHLIAKLFQLSQYIPYLSMEDVFVTGVLRLTAGIPIVDLSPQFCLSLCNFTDNLIAYFSVGTDQLIKAWEDFSTQKANLSSSTVG